MTDVICVDASPGRRTPATDSVTGLRFLARYVVVGEHAPSRCAYCGEACAKVRLAELPGLYGWCSRRFVKPSPPEKSVVFEGNFVDVRFAEKIT